MHIDYRPARRRRLSMTSLIDIIFLLLLFFMLSSTFTRFGEVEFGNTARGGAGGPAPDVLIVLEEENWTINGIASDPAGAARVLAGFAKKGATSALILPREGASTQTLVEAVGRVRRIDGFTVSIAR
ncbi:biopolymer transporter ExbD [Roseibium salinum]|uniref:Biopolymer transporter ExbD n=1 Tax=Roseibium salinum TaxID=1604349 RepID=A0ABT3QWW5_9HYPH|nr:biopolymer transporter ExbD [Roseibium sp. DSM 29163]MCX2721416.1 biopolymer transporter ExbD [Roseibium sp. DSM 29163]